MAANYVLLERIELNASAASVTFSNIPQSGYTDLKVVFSGRTNSGATTDEARLTFNGSSSGYSWRLLYGSGSGTGSASGSSDVAIYGIQLDGGTATANTFGNGEIYIPNYNSTSTYKSVSIDVVDENNATAAYAKLVAGLWANNSAITSITISNASGSLVQYSTFSLYGLAAVGTTPVIAPKASGGNRIDNDGTYWYHTFLTTSAFVPQTGLTCDVMVVAGGGGGCSNASSGGGGAGGLLTFTSQALTAATSYTATIGGGGAVGAAPSGSSGTNSQFGALTASVGGGGGAANNTTGGNGGSGGGGGGGSSAQAGGTATSGQGFNGGAGYAPGSDQQGGGGGGAGAVGQAGLGAGTGAPQTGGAGGIGLTNSLINAIGAATGTGQLVSGNYYYAGGGGAHFAGSGGSGGGGGGTTAGLINGFTNTGGGGKGGGSGLSGSGGSGIVIIRYPIA